MGKPRVIIADEDESYIVPLQYKFATDFFDKIDLEIITDKTYFEVLFSKPQNADVLIVSDELYDTFLNRHNIRNIFVMMEQFDESGTGDLSVTRLSKYTSIKEIFNEIVGKSAEDLNVAAAEKKETQVLLFYSANGGTGKTTVSMGVSASLSRSYKRVLYINAAYLQAFQHMLDNFSPIASADVYEKLSKAGDDIYDEIKHVIRKEGFSYLPPFRSSLLSLGLGYRIYQKIIESAKRSGDYDYIVVDAEMTFDDEKASLINMADRVIIIVNQTMPSVLATNLLVSNINGITSEKYVFICNNFDRDSDNALVSPKINLKFSISDYVYHFDHCLIMKPVDLSKESSVQKVAFLIV